MLAAYYPLDHKMERNESASPAEKRERFSRLAHDVAPVLIRIARRLCPFDEDTAQDLVQQTLVSAYERFLKDDLTIGPGTPKWLIRSLTNEFLQRIRKDKRITWTSEAGETVTSPEPNPEQVVLQKESASNIDQALLALTPEHRACLVLVDLNDYNYQEAADLLRIPVGTVRSRLSRARLKMAEQIMIQKDRGQQ